MTNVNFGDFRDPLKQNLTLQFFRTRNKDVSILTETHINLDQIHHIRNDWLGASFFSPGNSCTKGLLVLLFLDLEGIIEVDADPKGRFVSFKVILCNGRVLCVYAPSGHNTRKQLARGRFFEGLQNYVESKNEGNENNIILRDSNCTMDKMERNGRNKTPYRCRFNYALSKLIMDNGGWRTQIPPSSLATIDLLVQDLG